MPLEVLAATGRRWTSIPLCIHVDLPIEPIKATRTRSRTATSDGGPHVPAAYCGNWVTYSILRGTMQAVRYNTVQHFSWSVSMTAAARLDLRLSMKDRERIDRAAALAGLPLAAFVRTAVLREADRTVAAESVATLSLTESKRFLAALGKPFAPNAALRRALKRGSELGI